MNSNKFDFADEVTVEGRTLFVEAVFHWDIEAVDYEFRPEMGYAGAGRDTLANVPQAVEKIAVFDEENKPVTDAETVKAAGEAAMNYLRDRAETVKGRWV